MSVQAGIWNLSGEPVQEQLLAQMSTTTASYGPDGEMTYLVGPVGMLYRPLHTTSESRLEQQPHISSMGNVVTWDGRLDNREQVVPQLFDDSTNCRADVAIVAAAFDRWGTDCFVRLRGDWAVSVWCPKDRQLVLSRDYIGVRPLFYYLCRERLRWCSHLAALALSGDHFTVCDEYVAGYLAFYPDAYLTPYNEIQSVPPGTFISVRGGQAKTHRYWAFNTQLRIHYKTDVEYEEQYRFLFRQAVRRRLRSDAPILAELSGGFDSSSIVCMADDIMAKEGAETKRLDTFSFYDPNEPDEDDFRYLSTVEDKRGRKGFHVDLETHNSAPLFSYPAFMANPYFGNRAGTEAALSKILREGGFRILLSGTGGDEVNGQALDPRVAMADLLWRFRWIKFCKQLTIWSLLIRRRPWIQLFLQSLLELAPVPVRARLTDQGRIAPFVNHTFAQKFKMSYRQIEAVSGTLFMRPATRDAVQTIATLSRRMTSAQPSLVERRHPYLDQDLVEFLSAIPIEQLQHAGQRRFLMRRALASILPAEVLTRTTKSRIARCYCLLVQSQWAELVSSLSSPISSSLGYIDKKGLHEGLLGLRNGHVPGYSLGLLKAVALEAWLRDTCVRGIMRIPGSKIMKQNPSAQTPSSVVIE